MMKNKSIFFTFVIFTSLVFVATINSAEVQPEAIKASIDIPPAENRGYNDCLKTITAKDLKELVYYLSSDYFCGRRAGTKEADQVAEFLAKYMRSAGYKVGYQTFNGRIGTMKNVLAWREGVTLSNEIIVVGAHYDHLGTGSEGSRDGFGQHPGADDNASGVAAVLRIGAALSKTNLKRTTVFQFYSGEEQGMVGSRHYCQSPLFPEGKPDLRAHKLMFNIDMIGHYHEPFILRSSNGSLPPTSDHEPFERAGIPVIFIHTTNNDGYHTRRDTPDTLDYQGMETITKKVFDLVWRGIQN